MMLYVAYPHQWTLMNAKVIHPVGAGDRPLRDTLHLCLPFLTLLDVLRPSTCSKSMADACRQQLALGNSQLAHQLLQDAVEQTAVLAPQDIGAWSREKAVQKQLERFRKALAWLLDAMSSKPLFSHHSQNSTIETSTTSLLVLKGTALIPLDLAKRLVQSGLRVSYSQLVTAARAGVPGISVWSHAQQQCGVETDVPQYAKYAALCSWEWSGVQVPIDSMSCKELTDYMYLVANGLPAIDKGRPNNRYNCQLRAMDKALRSETVKQMSTDDILGLMKLATRDPKINWEDRVQALLCRLPAAAHITVEQMTKEGDGLLELAVRRGDGALVHSCLSVVPAAEQIDPAEIIRLFKVYINGGRRRKEAAAQMMADAVPEALLRSEAGKKISVASAVALIHAVKACGNKQHQGLAMDILRLPACAADRFLKYQLMDLAGKMGWYDLELELAAAPW